MNFHAYLWHHHMPAHYMAVISDNNIVESYKCDWLQFKKSKSGCNYVWLSGTKSDGVVLPLNYYASKTKSYPGKITAETNQKWRFISHTMSGDVYRHKETGLLRHHVDQLGDDAVIEKHASALRWVGITLAEQFSSPWVFYQPAISE